MSLESKLQWCLVALIVVLCALATGCGSSGALNPAFARRWTGPATVSGQGFTTFSYPAALTIGVNGDTATVSEICPDDSGSVTVQGTGNAAEWSGNYECPPVTIGGCSMRITYTSAKMSITQDGKQLTVAGNGSMSGCGVSTPIRNEFTGS